MNAIESILRGGAAVHLSAHLHEGETYLVGPGGLRGPGEAPRALLGLVDNLRRQAPEGTRLTAWFSVARRGGRTHGQIAVDTGTGTPAVVWSLDASEIRLAYPSDVTVSFSCVSDQMVAMAEPMAVVRNAPCGERTTAIIEALGYAPRVPFGSEARVSFSSLDLVSQELAA